jgi:hypothetical protein
MNGTAWTEMEILQTLKVYVDIRDKGVDKGAAIGRLAALLDRSRGSIEAAVMAPAKEDPLWRGDRPHRGLTNTLAMALWKRFSKDLSGLVMEAARCEETLRALRRKGRL